MDSDITTPRDDTFVGTILSLREKIHSVSAALDAVIRAHDREIKSVRRSLSSETRMEAKVIVELDSDCSSCEHIDKEKILDPTVGSRGSSHIVDGLDRSQCGVGSRQACSSISLLEEALPEAPVTEEAQAKIVADGSDDSVKRLIQSPWDPNYSFRNITVKNKHFLHVTPLACAVLRNRIELARWLIEHGANPDSDYSFTAGSAGIVWSGACSHAAIPSGNLTLLKELLTLNSDINSVGSNGASLLWQAAYFNQKEIAYYLIKHKCNIEKRAISQDRSAASHTPLHTAAFHGHAELVSVLLEGNASVSIHDRDGTLPFNLATGNSVLKDAILQGHPDVAKLLIEHSADLFEVMTPVTDDHQKQNSVFNNGDKVFVLSSKGLTGVVIDPNWHNNVKVYMDKDDDKGRVKTFKSDEIHIIEDDRACVATRSSGTALSSGGRCSHMDHFTKSGFRLLDVVLELNNPILIASVAEGLKKTPKLVDQLTNQDVVRFIRHSKGEAARCIMEAAFRPYGIRYWDVQENGQKIRQHRKTAFIDGHNLFNIALGPHSDFIRESFNNKQAPPDAWMDFFDQLAPIDPIFRRRDFFAGVKFLMCHVPDACENLQLLLAIADCKSDALFETSGCRAILAMATLEVKASTRVRLVIAVIEVFDLALLILVINEPWFRIHLSGMAAYFATCVFLTECIALSAAGMGYWLQGLLGRFMRDWHHLVILLLYGGVLVPTWIEVRNSGPEDEVSKIYRCCLGVVVFIKYMQLLFLACQFRFVGMRILPITSVFFDIGPFLFVMFFCVSSSVTMYYALGIREFARSFTIIYKLILVGDLHMEEMEFVPDAELHLQNETGYIEQTLPGKTDYFFIVIAVMVFITLTMSLTLMNLFIAILNISYDKAAKTAEVHFLKNNANFIVDAHAVRLAYKTFKSALCKKRLSDDIHRAPSSTSSHGIGTGAAANEDSLSFLWLCLRDE